MTIRAIFEGGVFKPIEPVQLPDGCVVTFDPSLVEPTQTVEIQVEKYLHWLKNRTSEELEKTREELRKASRPSRPLPPGKSLSDMVEGKWPGEETDGQIREALERLS